MTDRVKSLTVVLESDVRTDDVKPLIDAISQLRGVLAVTRTIAEPMDFVAEARVRHDLERKLWEVLHPPDKK